MCRSLGALCSGCSFLRSLFLACKAACGPEGRSLTGPPALSCGGRALTSRGLGMSHIRAELLVSLEIGFQGHPNPLTPAQLWVLVACSSGGSTFTCSGQRGPHAVSTVTLCSQERG